MSNMNFKDIITAKRIELSISKEEMARRCDVSVSTYKRFEKNGKPGIEEKALEALGIKILFIDKNLNGL